MDYAREWIEHGFPAKRVLKIVSVSRSTYYYRLAHPPSKKSATGGRPIPGFSRNKKGKKVKDSTIKNYLLKLIGGKEGVYGYRKLTRCLQRKYHLNVNKKKVYRLCKELDILLPQREKKQKYPRRLAKNRIVTGSNQLWQLDIKYGYVTSSRRFFYLASVIDVHDRGIIGHYRGTVCEAKHITKMLQKALMTREIHASEDIQSLIIRTDNGPQFISKHFQEFCMTQQVEHERIPPSSPNMNAYIESFHSILERECYQRNEFITFEDAYSCVDEFIQFYNEERYHGSLNDYSPLEYYQKWQAGETKQVEQAM
ncbi:IS3 family transposase [Halalkalibacter alkaliphilus]|uniref:IS3 family transposase n=1 Tax=Halalkalibacter alkaliphilus TaxID=2917993 RepID=UPI003083F5C7